MASKGTRPKNFPPAFPYSPLSFCLVWFYTGLQPSFYKHLLRIDGNEAILLLSPTHRDRLRAPRFGSNAPTFFLFQLGFDSDYRFARYRAIDCRAPISQSCRDGEGPPRTERVISRSSCIW